MMTTSFISLSVLTPSRTSQPERNTCPILKQSLRDSSFVVPLAKPPLSSSIVQSSPPGGPGGPAVPIKCDSSEATTKLAEQHPQKNYSAFASQPLSNQSRQQLQRQNDEQHGWRNSIKPGAVVEAWVHGELRFGIVESLYDRGGFVCFASVEELSPSLADAVKVSYGEIIAVWPSTLINSSVDDVGEYLLRALAEATKLLRHASPKAIDLSKVYTAMRKLPKNHPRSSLTSAEICHALFRPKPTHTRLRRAVLTAATAILLAADTIRFKRSQPGHGWRALPASVTVSRGRCSFIDTCNAILEVRRSGSDKNRAPTVWNREQLDILRDLEVVAASGTSASGTAAFVLESLGYDPNDDGAATLLLDINYWATGRYEARLRNRAVAKVDTYVTNSSEFSDEKKRQEAAAEAVQKREREENEWTFAPSLLAEARDIRAVAREKRKSYMDARTARQSSKRRSLLHGQSALRVYCIDDKSSRFLDDAVSVRVLQGGEVIRLWLHIVDVDEIVRSGSALDTFAKERGQSMYLPLKPLHMLPAAAMDAASFSASYATEAVTVMLDYDVRKDVVRHWEVFASIVPPVTRINYDQFDIAMEHGAKAAQLDPEAYEDLQDIARVAPLLADKLDHRANRKARRPSDGNDSDEENGESENGFGNRLIEAFDDKSVASVKLIKRSDRSGGVRGLGRIAKVVNFQMTGSHQVVNDILTCAGGVLRQFARENRAYLPEGRDAFLYVGRCGTAPLRRYSDLAIQRQIKCVLFGRQPAGKRRMDELKIWLAKRQAAAERTVSERRRSALFESFSSFCAQKCVATGAPRATVRGQVRNVSVTKKGRLRIGVALDGTGLSTTASATPDVERFVFDGGTNAPRTESRGMNACFALPDRKSPAIHMSKWK